MLRYIFVFLLTELLIISVAQAGILPCLDTSGLHVTAEVRSADVLQADKAAQAVLTSPEGYRSPVLDVNACSIKRVGEANTVVQAAWHDGRLMISGYDSLWSFISFAYGAEGKSLLLEDLKLSIYVKATSEAAYHHLLEATLGKETSPVHSLQVRYMHERFPNQQQDVLLVWNVVGESDEKQPLNVLGVRYQYDGAKLQP